MIPSSFATLATKSCAFELVGLLLSLSLFHPRAKIFIMCDSVTKKKISEMTPQPNLKIIWEVALNKYTDLNRNLMEQQGIFTDFLASKSKIMLRALKESKDVLFLDSDIIVMNTLKGVKDKRKLGVSRQFVNDKILRETGEFNAGMIWTNSVDVCRDWIKYSKSSRYFEQAAIENLVEKYSYFEFGEEYNVQCWRYYLNPNPETEPFEKNISIGPDNMLLYKNEPFRCIHTHLRDDRFTAFNSLIISYLNKTKNYRLLMILSRTLNEKWHIRIPKNQHMDSFRELACLMADKTPDLVVSKTNEKHCWLTPNILLYDRPTLEWCDRSLSSASLILLGNGDIKNEGKALEEKFNATVMPWIFWPRHPTLVEGSIKSITERTINCIFIGNIENSVQNFHREKYINEWKDVVEHFECIYGKKHKYTQKEYLNKLQKSKYGLCLRGYGAKCHREIELMALGTVPIVVEGVNTDSFMEPLIEGKHFFRAESPKKLTSIIKNTSSEKWKKMSKNCVDWYIRNIHSKNAWSTMLSHILT